MNMRNTKHLYSEVGELDGVRRVDVVNFKNCEIFDARDEPEGLSLININYAVYQARIAGQYSYHAQMVAADNGIELGTGIRMAGEKTAAQIAASSGVAPEFIQPVFIRNLYADEERIATSCRDGGLTEKMEQLVSSGPDLQRYVVIGLMLDDAMKEELLLEDVKADSAVAAIGRVSAEVMAQTGRSFIPMFSAVKATLLHDLMARYMASSKHFVTLVETPRLDAAMMH